MALKWVESFETAQSVNAAQGKYAAGGVNVTPCRTGNGGTVNGGSLFSKPIASGANTMYYGFVMQLSGLPGSDQLWFSVGEDYSAVAGELSPIHVAIYVTSAGKLKVTRGKNIATLGTGTKVLTVGSQYHVQLKVKCHGTLGEIELQIDSLPELGTGSVGGPLTSQNTRNGGAGLLTSFQFNWPAGSWIVDDFWACDDQGTVNNGFLGVCAVQTRDAILAGVTLANAGGMNDWTVSGLTSGVADHGAMVDEAAPDGDTTYVFSSTVGHIDTYKYPALTVTGPTVLGVQENFYAKKIDVGARTLNGVCRIGSTNYDAPAAAFQLSTAYSYYSVIFEVNPSTGAPWASQAAVNAAEFGVKLVA